MQRSNLDYLTDPLGLGRPHEWAPQGDIETDIGDPMEKLMIALPFLKGGNKGVASIALSERMPNL